MTKITAYGLAAGLSLTRVLARQHFPSDVLVGSAVGWLVGRYVFHKHHNEDY
jgi:membrane-associated phospholipid phosphatase